MTTRPDEPIYATCGGIVEDDKDPLGVFRLRIRVPILHGPLSNGETISTGDLPWALPTGLPAGATPDSGAITWLPKIGDPVFVRFLDGDPEKPIWEWGNQNLTQAKAFPVHNELGTAYPPPGTEFTRFGHFITLEQTRLRVVTKAGYTLILDDANKQLALITPAGNYLKLDDRAGVATIQAPEIDLGENATDAVVRLSDLQAVCDWANTHTHGGVKQGGDSTDVPDQTVDPTASQVSYSL